MYSTSKKESNLHNVSQCRELALPDSTRIALCKAARCQPLDILIKGRAWRHIFERLPAHWFIPAHGKAQELGELSARCRVAGSVIGLVIGTARLRRVFCP